MVSFVSRKAFEMAMRVSLTRLDSSIMSRENVVLNFTILFDSKSNVTINPLDEIEVHYLREYASGIKKVEHFPCWGKCSMSLPFLKGPCYQHCKYRAYILNFQGFP